MPIDDTFNMSPDEAIKWFQNKGLEPTWNWMDIWQEQHAKAFTVAKSMSYDILNDVYKATQAALSQGLTKRQFRASLEKTLKSKGWWGKQQVINPDGQLQNVKLGSPWRLNLIYQTNLQSAMMAGRWKQFYSNKENRPYLQYVAVMDPSTRHSHAALHGKIFHIDNPIWQKIFPPNGFNCRCRVRALTEKQAKVRGYKKSNDANLPADFPDLGFAHNAGIGQVANDIKGWKSWYKMYELNNNAFVKQQLKDHFNGLINIGLFAQFFDDALARKKAVGEQIVTGYLNKTIYDDFKPWAKHGAIIIPDKIVGKGISETDWRLLPSYLTGNLKTEIVKQHIEITFKQRKGSKIIRLIVGKDMIIRSANYED